MPILNMPLGPEGPIVEISVGVSEQWRQALQSAGQAVPPPILLRAIIDSGASQTNIVASAIQPLGLLPKGTSQVTTPSTGLKPIIVDEYDVSLTILDPAMEKVFSAVSILECQPLSSNFEVLLGRDLLDHCLFVYNGPHQTFSLAF